eukprot:6186585-Pleurochrysis_carterae.AAC.1
MAKYTKTSKVHNLRSHGQPRHQFQYTLKDNTVLDLQNKWGVYGAAIVVVKERHPSKESACLVERVLASPKYRMCWSEAVQKPTCSENNGMRCQ